MSQENVIVHPVQGSSPVGNVVNPYSAPLVRTATIGQAIAGHVPATREYAEKRTNNGSRKIADLAYSDEHFDTTLALRYAYRYLARTTDATGTGGEDALRRTSQHHIGRVNSHDAMDIAADAFVWWTSKLVRRKVDGVKTYVPLREIILASAKSKNVPAERMVQFCTASVVRARFRDWQVKERYRKLASLGNLELAERVGSLREHTLSIPDTHSKAELLRAVASLLGQGMTKEDIAKRLDVSRRTIFYAVSALRNYVEIYYSHESTIPHQPTSNIRADLYGQPTVREQLLDANDVTYASTAARLGYQWQGSGI